MFFDCHLLDLTSLGASRVWRWIFRLKVQVEMKMMSNSAQHGPTKKGDPFTLSDMFNSNY